MTVPAVSVSTSSNGADWHVGVLELPNGNADTNEDFFFSGVYIENGSITTSVAGPGGVVTNPTTTTAVQVCSEAICNPYNLGSQSDSNYRQPVLLPLPAA